MGFNFKLLFAVLYRSFWRTRGSDAQLTIKRILVMLIMFPLYILIELANWLGFMLDEIIFPGYRRQTVNTPVFIVGVQRSGTTFLHRLMEKDNKNFTSMKLWEIIFAPSVIQKKVFNMIGFLDGRCGGLLKNLVIKLETHLFKNLTNFHKNSFFAAEEDEFVLVHIFSSLFLITMFPFADLFRPFVYFDQQLDSKQKATIMAFYKRCVQNHLYVFGRDKHFLSKNPFFSGMIWSLNEIFPDAKFICLVRTPLEVVPSAISLWTTSLHFFLSPPDPLPLFDAQREIISHYYRYPLEQLAAMPPERQHVINYHELVTHPVQTVSAIYTRLGFTITPAFMAMLQHEEEKARAYKSRHEYSLEQFGFSCKDILTAYEDIFKRFGFDRQP
mgnify:CR=1 FL=1